MVSIIIPAFNAEKYLRECLDSAVGQTCRDIEIIVVDGGSTDSTGRIIAEYATCDNRVRPLVQPQSGVSAARNAALRIAGGEWVSFLDSDDVLYPDSIKMLLGAAQVSGCDLVYGGWRRGIEFKQIDESRSDAAPRVCDRLDVIEKVLYQSEGIVPAPWGKLYRRECLRDVCFDEGCIYEDLDLFYKVEGRDGKIAVIDAPVYFYRDTPGSLTNRFSPARLDVLKVTSRLEDFMAGNCPGLLPAARDRRLSANFNMYCLLAIHDRNGEYARISHECWQLIRRYRRESLLNPHVRMKNKLGILVSYLGERMLKAVSPLVYGGSRKNR